MGYLAAQNLVAIIEKQNQPQENIVVPVELIERQTVKRL
jgi:GntR family transcriptional regulator of arabinose operon